MSITHDYKRHVALCGLIGMTLLITCGLSGCDAIYRLLQKEGAEEKDLLGELDVLQPNEKVKTIQKLLKLYGYGVGNVDGILGVNTRESIEAFQEANGLETTRFVDNQTWDVLNQFATYGLVVDGELNIIAAQHALKAAGFDTGGVDGKMGRKTEKAILDFQKSKGLKPDGKVGFKTLSAMKEYLLPVN